MNLNKASLIGRVTRDPEVRALPSGTKVVKFGVATNHTYKTGEGEKKETVQFHNCVAFGKLAEIIGDYVKKGQLIYVDGRIEYQEWEKDGVKRTSTEIVVENMQMGPKAGNGGQGGSSGQNRSNTGRSGDGFGDEESPEGSGGEDINPDDIPF